ncbi:MAG: hypothetical protein V9E89_16930 [Ilumatobacteraceae bacterium]
MLSRTDQLERSIEDALRSAGEASGRSDAERAQRLEQLRGEITQTDGISADLLALRNEVVAVHG